MRGARSACTHAAAGLPAAPRAAGSAADAAMPRRNAPSGHMPKGTARADLATTSCTAGSTVSDPGQS
eukprot:700351-Alexandrium_andersonii.AAC.1